MSTAMKIASVEQLLEPFVTERPLALNEPASSHEIAECEEGLGRALPDELKSVYFIYNGQRRSSTTGLLFDRHLCSTEQLLVEFGTRRSLKLAYPTAEERDDLGSFASHPSQCVQHEMFCEDWTPFAIDGSGSQIFLDYAPGPNGTKGQVVGLDVEQSEYYLLAPSLSAFLDLVIATNERGIGSSVLSRSWSYPTYEQIIAFQT